MSDVAAPNTQQQGQLKLVDLDSAFETVKRSEAGVEIELLNLKTHKGSGAFITVCGMDSDVFRAAKVDRARVIAKKTEAGEEVTAADIEEMQIELLARCTKGWRNIARAGELLEFSLDAARKLYRDFPAIREQINQAIGDRGNFVGA